MVRSRQHEPVYEATLRFADAALRSDDSLFTPGRAIWAPEVLEDLYERFIRQPDESSDSFEEKFERQLAGAPAETIQLAGETLYVHFLIALNIRGDKKREIIDHVLSWSPSRTEIPDDLKAALDRGLANVGVAFNTYRPFQLQFILDFVRQWKELDEAEVQRLLKDPWAFKEFFETVPVKAAYMQKEALLHLLHPDTFERIIARDMKKRIAQHFAGLVTEATPDIDRQLLQIRRGLAEEHGSEFNFWDPPIIAQWQTDSSKWGQFIEWARRFYDDPRFDELERDYKLTIAERLEDARTAVVQGEKDWLDNLKKAFAPPNNLTSWRAHSSFLEWCASESQTALAALRAFWATSGTASARIQRLLEALPKEVVSGVGSRASLASFLHMAVDPWTYPFFKITAFQKAYELTGFPELDREADETETYLHALRFLDKLSEEASKRGLEFRDRLDAQGVLWSIAGAKDAPTRLKPEERVAFCKYVGLPPPQGPTVDDNGEETTAAGPPSTLDELADDLLLDAGYLRQIDRLLRAKQQLIFHGPPGTGKTYVARQLARLYASDGGAFEVVQFHPSYAYEDFIEGYRPTLLEGRPGFKPKDGPLKRIARDAAAKPGSTFVLLIDEINRGNLAKVFGELYFLLEYRDEEIILQYTEDRFSLPQNLWILGTMNTADRSIALVDSALRRRFHFIPFFPDEPPIQGLLRRWLKEHKPALEWVADVVRTANERLGDRHTAIGPSYFMREDLDDEWVELIWNHSVLPYLQEQFFGEEGRLADFQLDRLRSELSRNSGN